VADGDDARLLQAGARRMLRGSLDNQFLLDRRIVAAVVANYGSIP
jgi:hypothetical protein